jgi:hypothetical protein
MSQIRWEPLLQKNPIFFERLLAVGIPHHQQTVFVAYEGVYLASWKTLPVSVLFDERFKEGHGLLSRDRHMISYEAAAYQSLGLWGGTPLLYNAWGESIELTPEQISLTDSQGKVVFITSFEDFSGDWQVATFSQEGEQVLLATPYQVWLFRRMVVG